MKCSTYDKFQALRYSHLYQADYREYEQRRKESGIMDVIVGHPNMSDKGRIEIVKPKKKPLQLFHVRALSEAGKELCHKWRIYCPFNPFCDYSKDQIDTVLKIISPPVQFLEPTEDWHEVKAVDVNGTRMITQIDDRLSLTIDPSFNLEDIEDAIHKIVQNWKSKTDGRKRDLLEDMWEIYRMIEIEKMSPLEATRSIHGFTGHPIYDGYDDALKRINRAYKKACSIIKNLEFQRRNIIS